MASYEENVISGAEMFGSVCKKSVGIQIFNSLKANPHKQMIDATTNVSINFLQIFEASCSIAKWLEVNGCKRNEIISICSENNIHFFKPAIAALYSGIIVTCISHIYTEYELLHALTLTKPKFVFCSLATSKKFHSLYAKKKIPFVERILILENLDDDPEMPKTNSFEPLEFNTKEQTAAILYSSGTTGLSKAVMISHHNINIREIKEIDPSFIPIVSNIRNLLPVPFYHALGFLVGLSHFITGRSLIFLQKFEELKYLAAIEKYRIDFLLTVPPLMVLFAKSPNVDKFDLTCIKNIACGGAPMSKELENSIRKRFPRVENFFQVYGMTETTLALVGFPKKNNKTNKFGSCGKILPGNQAKIRDVETGKNLGPNKVGEICIKSSSIMQGYYKNLKATKAMISEDGWLSTGDLGYYDEDEYLYIVDRLKELIKFKGYQVAPAELEALLLKHPKIADAAVIGLPDESVGEKPLAFIVKQEGVELNEKDVKKWVADTVSYVKQLHGGVRFVSTIPKNASGKILRRDLRKLVTKSKL